MEFDFRHKEKFFIDKNGDKREKIIELKITKYDKNDISIEIEFQNDNVIERGFFYDKEIGVASAKKIGLAYQDCVVLEEKGNIKFITQKKKVKESPNPKVKILFIVGLFSNVDDELENYLKVTKQELKEIEKKINLLYE